MSERSYQITLRYDNETEVYTVFAKNGDDATSEALELAHKVSLEKNQDWRIVRIEA